MGPQLLVCIICTSPVLRALMRFWLSGMGLNVTESR